MSDDTIFIAKVIGIIILIFVGVFVGICYLVASVHNCQQYDVTVIVQALEKSTTFGEHTYVWCLVYGDQDITYNFFGYHDFEIGKVYHIKFVDRLYWQWLVFANIRGEITLKEQLGGG